MNNRLNLFVGLKQTDIHSLMNSIVEKDLGSLELVSDEIIHLFDHTQQCFSNVEYRLIVAKRKEELDTIPPSNK